MATTTKAILAQLIGALGDQYAEVLDNLPIKKPLREAMKDAFRAGVAEGVQHTVKMLEIEVKD